MNPTVEPVATALVVDDERAITEIVAAKLAAAGYSCRTAANGAQALQLLAHEQADFVLTDVRMPGMSGLELLEQVRAHYPDTYVLLLTGAADVHMVVRALRSGACDFLTKPFSLRELCERMTVARQKRASMLAETQASRSRESEINLLKQDYIQLSEGVLSSLRTVLGITHPETSAHSERVARRAALTAAALGMGEDEVRGVYLAGLLHDLGKVTLDHSLLNKPGRLSAGESEEMRTHPERAARIVSSVPLPASALEAIRHHHERYDGTGYPDHLRSDQIPLSARVLSVCDAFDAMTSARAYQPAVPAEEGIRRLRAGAGTQWDPDVVNAFCRHARPDEPAIAG